MEKQSGEILEQFAKKKEEMLATHKNITEGINTLPDISEIINPQIGGKTSGEINEHFDKGDQQINTIEVAPLKEITLSISNKLRSAALDGTISNDEYLNILTKSKKEIQEMNGIYIRVGPLSIGHTRI